MTGMNGVKISVFWEWGLLGGKDGREHSVFQAFGPLLFGRRNQLAMESYSRLESLDDLYAIFGDLFAEWLLERSDKGVNSRRRTLPPQVTFWAFVAQVLSPKSSCCEVVRRVEAWWRWGQLRSAASVSASAYCQARQRLDLPTLRLIQGPGGVATGAHRAQGRTVAGGARGEDRRWHEFFDAGHRSQSGALAATQRTTARLRLSRGQDGGAFFPGQRGTVGTKRGQPPRAR
jgi:hypothetical protein